MIIVSAAPIDDGKVIAPLASTSCPGFNIEADQVGRVVMQAVANARMAGYHMGATNAWVRVEFKQADD